MSIRVAIAGFGLAGEVFHAPLLASVDGFEVARIMTRNEDRAARARAQYPDAIVVDSVEALLDDADLLVVASSNRSHLPLAEAAFERDLPVVMDKPMAANVDDARRMVDAGGRLTVFQNRRLDGDFLTVKRLVDEGALGDVTRMESRFERFRPQVDPTGWREFADVAEGGGQLLDLGPHLVDQAVQLFGWPRAVYGEVLVRRAGGAVNDDVFVALEHPGGVRSHLWMSVISALHGPRFRVSGLTGGFACDGLDPQEAQLEAGLRPGDADYGLAGTGLLNNEPVQLERGRYEDFYAAVRDWVSGDAPPPVDPADSLRVLEVLEAARRSSEAREIVSLEG